MPHGNLPVSFISKSQKDQTTVSLVFAKKHCVTWSSFFAERWKQFFVIFWILWHKTLGQIARSEGPKVLQNTYLTPCSAPRAVRTPTGTRPGPWTPASRWAPGCSSTAASVATSSPASGPVYQGAQVKTRSKWRRIFNFCKKWIENRGEFEFLTAKTW